MGRKDKVVVDTCVFLRLLYGEKNWHAAAEFLRKNRGKLVISVITLSEILASAHKQLAEVEAVEATMLIEHLVGEKCIVPLTAEIAKLAGKLKARYTPNFSLGDAVILATALSVGASKLATYDSEFGKVKELEIVRP